jgi:hypothetical protein
MDKNEERNEHFKGFANLLWQDLLEANGYGYIDVTTDDDPTDPTNYLEIIAQRAYDLVYHTIENAGEIDLIPSTAAAVAVIPDLTQWPQKDTSND